MDGATDRRPLHTRGLFARKIDRCERPAMAKHGTEPAPGLPTYENIDVGDPKSMIYWCTRLKCTDEELRFVVKHYGVVARDIEAFFARCRY